MKPRGTTLETISAKTERVLNQLKERGIISLSEAEHLGLSKAVVSRLTAADKLIRVRKGFYVHPDSKAEPRTYDFTIACSYFGSTSLIGGLSALFHHGLIEQVPRKIWVMVPTNQKSITKLFRCIRTQTNPKVGVENHGTFRISNLERTIIEGLRYASKIGSITAIKAARLAIAEKRTNEMKLGRQATALGLRSVFEKYWDVITT